MKQQEVKDWWDSHQMRVYRGFLRHLKKDWQELLDLNKEAWAESPYMATDRLCADTARLNISSEVIDRLLDIEHVEQALIAAGIVEEDK